MNPWQQVIAATSGSIPGPSVGLEDCELRAIDATHALFIASRNSFSATDAFVGVVEFDATPSIAVVGTPLAVPGTPGSGLYAWSGLSTVLPGTNLALLLGGYTQPGGSTYTAHQLVSFDTSTGACTLIGDPKPWGAGSGVAGENPITVNPSGSGLPPGANGWAVGLDATHILYGFTLTMPGDSVDSQWVAVASIDTSTGIMTYLSEAQAVPASVEPAHGDVPSRLSVASADWLFTTFDGSIFRATWSGSAVTTAVVYASNSTLFAALDVVSFGGEVRAYGADFGGVVAGDYCYAAVASGYSGIGALNSLLGADGHGDLTNPAARQGAAVTGDGHRMFVAGTTGRGFIVHPTDLHLLSEAGVINSGATFLTAPGSYVASYGGPNTNHFVLVGQELTDRFAEADVGPPDFATAVDTGQPVTVDCSTDHLDNYWRPIASWMLDWGDGTIETGSGPLTAEPYGPTFPDIVLNRPHTFFLPGTYVVTFSVVDSLAIASTPDIPVTFVVTRTTPPWQRSYPRPDDLGAGSHRSYPPPATRQRSSRSIPAAIE